MKILIITFLLLMSPAVGLSYNQEHWTFNPEKSPVPRRSNDAERPGSYELMIKVLNPIIDPGDNIEIEIYVTGYGIIKGNKLVCKPSSMIFDENLSSVSFGLKFDGKNISFGKPWEKFSTSGFTAHLGGMKTKNWENETSFFDLNEAQPAMIITEAKVEKAPFSFTLKTIDKIRPGNYYIDFGFTYFNGNEWKVSKGRVDFSVRNILQRNEVLIATIACLAAIFSIISPLVVFFKK